MLLAVVAAPLLLLAGCAAEKPPPSGTPRLILFIVVDQARYDYLERFRPLLRSGLARLLDESVVFTNAHHDHAITTTAPGHATLATGRHPSNHGIINNWWVDRSSGKRVAAIGSPPSPKALLASTFGDWLKSTYPRSKVYAAGGKDRSAVLLAGEEADGAYWTRADNGRFVSSRFYHLTEPAWLGTYHQDFFPHRYFGQAWEALPEVVEQGQAYGIEALDSGTLKLQFPHPIGPAWPAPSPSFYSTLIKYTPFGDAYLADFAQTLIETQDLGSDAYPDYLGLAFSALDRIGHTWGPDSPEFLDTLLRLDRSLGELLAFVDQHVGLEHTLVSLSSDHGVTPVPEILKARGGRARRFGAEETLCFQQSREALHGRFGEEEWYRMDFYLDRQMVATSRFKPVELENEARRLIELCPGVERVWTRSELEAEAGGEQAGDEEMRRLYAHSFHPERSPDLLVQLEPHTLPMAGTNVTTHGTPYPYDTHVPWLLRLPSGTGARVHVAVSTVDVAPTLAHLSGIAPPADLDGVDRRSLLPADGV